jgi:V8-like Glu-specific endopeptidase
MRRLLWIVIVIVVATPCVLADDARSKQLNSATDLSWMAAQTATREWTREEMMSAIAADVPSVSEREIGRWTIERNDEGVYDLTGGPGIEPAGYPDGMAVPRDRRQSLEAGESPFVPPVDDPAQQPYARFDTMSNGRPDEVRPLGYGYPAPYNRYETFPTYTDFPHATVGKVFFRKPDGKRYVCTASSVGGDAVITAAHCVIDGKTGTWWSDWIFAPAYKNGVSPYAQWTANHLWARAPYVNGLKGDNRFDVGGAVLNRRSLIRISARVGHLGFMWNANSSDTTAHWALIGYPQALPFTGELQFICQSSFAYNGAGGVPAPLGVGCDMTGGCSGGPWIRRYSKFLAASNYVNGVNSYRRCFDAACASQYTHELFSPYFDANVKALKDCLVNSVPGNPANPALGCAIGT